MRPDRAPPVVPGGSKLRTLAVSAALLGVAAGCDDSPSSSSGATLVGTWNATSFNAPGMDFIGEGMSLTIVFGSTGSFSPQIQNDLIGACEDEEPNCTQLGTYTSTSAQFTIDPTTSDATTFTYVIAGSTLTLTGDIDGTPVIIVFQRAS
ncbi:MAG: hypothetical protein WEG36_07070 [Gemmatimonadota bacterium]